jgi:hypothetical protein
LDSYSVVLFEDIEDYMFQICDADTKYKLIDLTLDLLGIGPQIMPGQGLLTFSHQRLAKDCLTIDNRMYDVFEKSIRSPHLCNFAVMLSSLLEKDLAVAQITKFECARNYLAKLLEVYPQSKVLQFTLFVIELTRSKSPYYQAIFEQTVLDQPFKAMLKDNQHNSDLWIAYIEMEALLNPEQAYMKIESLSSKVLKSFNSIEKSETKFIRVSIMDLYFRLTLTDSTSTLKVLVSIIQLAIQVIKDLGIQVSSYALELTEIVIEEGEDVLSFMAKHATSFLSLSKLTDKLLSSVIQLSGQSPIENTVDSSFINKKKSFCITDFTVLAVLQALFSVLAGTFSSESLWGSISAWAGVQEARQRQLSSVYVKQQRADLLACEVKSALLAVNGLLAFAGRLLPQRAASLAAANARVYARLLPLDASLLALLAQDCLARSYRFLFLADLKALGVRLNFAEVAALAFLLQRADPQGTENLQEFLLKTHAEKTLSKLLLEDLKATLTESEAEKSQRASWTWYSQGIGIIYQNNALLTLQEVMIARSLAKSPSSAASSILSCLHKAPFNKVHCFDSGILSCLSIPRGPASR